ncbi:YwgA family protein [Texcoconibacillus texcoconensis]|uniref:YwgA family protein n=1 Tax=Texcoconibacillus texcoconensis TaxID=1095777 RepID=A0A840QS31_9BACI|nr:YwgA family protein [Texcoconibacillus texcoconensis]MBB5174128.1 hypothetical protein [Texcoconibacillus texcoconensis]
MLQDHAKLLTLIRQAGEVVGRKKLQKLVYIAKKMNLPIYERYQFHIYGPYSEELTLRIEEMCNLGFLHEQQEAKSNYIQYRYSLSEEGDKFLSMAPYERPKHQELIETLNEQSAKFLELVSTVLYFEELSKAEVKEKVFTLKRKQNYTDEDVERAYDFIEEIRTGNKGA